MPWPDVDRPSLDRVMVTRLLCISFLAAWIVLILVALSLVVAPALADVTSGDMLGLLLPFAAVLMFWWWGGRVGLALWRRCDQCRELLFGDILYGRSARIPHWKSKTLGGSFFNATAWQYIRHGSAECPWCRHRDGDAPAYVVKK